MIWQIYFWAMLILVTVEVGLAGGKHGKVTQVSGWTTLIRAIFWLPAFFIMFKAIYR